MYGYWLVLRLMSAQGKIPCLYQFCVRLRSRFELLFDAVELVVLVVAVAQSLCKKHGVRSRAAKGRQLMLLHGFRPVL